MTLGVDPGSGSGTAEGPWGTNVIPAWRKATGMTVDLSATDVARPTPAEPALAEAPGATRYSYRSGFVARRFAEHIAAVRHLETVLRETALGCRD